MGPDPSEAEFVSEPLTISVEDAARLLGISRGLAYEAARSGQLPVIRLGRRLLVPRQRLYELVGAANGFPVDSREEVMREMTGVRRRPGGREATAADSAL
jgi:excisionase family DNA binding protein